METKKRRVRIGGKTSLYRYCRKKNEPISKQLYPKEYPVPSWFRSTEVVDVSVVVPMYKARNVIQQQIESWITSETNLKREIIYVDDKCPHNSKDQVIASWSDRILEIKSPIGKIIANPRNLGFGPTCNIGAKYATGQYIVFLNADCQVTPNWLEPMIDLLKSDKKIGMVGNLQTKDGYVDSAGSEWFWEYNSFEHIGRSIYQGKICHKMKIEEMPEALLVPGEREMVTGCCLAMPKDLFADLNGFDPIYRKGYWEDTDLCMRLRSKGYKIFYQPLSRIEHKSGHSKSNQQATVNKKKFIARWVDSGLIDSLVNCPRPNC